MRTFLCFLLCSCLLWGCKVSEPGDLYTYRAWFADAGNGFVKKRTVNQLEFAVQYAPSELMLLNEINGDESRVEVDSIKATYDNNHYFVVSFYPRSDEYGPTQNPIKGTAASLDQYNQLVEELAFNSQDRARLLSGGDTLYPNLYHYESAADYASVQRLIYSFPRTAANPEAFTFLFKDHLFMTGIQKFQFDINNLYVPQIPLRS